MCPVCQSSEAPCAVFPSPLVLEISSSYALLTNLVRFKTNHLLLLSLILGLFLRFWLVIFGVDCRVQH